LNIILVSIYPQKAEFKLIDVTCFSLDVRYREKSVIQKSLIVQSILNAIPQVGSVFAAFLTILIMSLTGNDITVVQVV